MIERTRPTCARPGAKSRHMVAGLTLISLGTVSISVSQMEKLRLSQGATCWMFHPIAHGRCWDMKQASGLHITHSRKERGNPFQLQALLGVWHLTRSPQLKPWSRKEEKVRGNEGQFPNWWTPEALLVCPPQFSCSVNPGGRCPPPLLPVRLCDQDTGPALHPPGLSVLTRPGGNVACSRTRTSLSLLP